MRNPKRRRPLDSGIETLNIKGLFGFCVSITHNSKYMGPTIAKSV